jgi:lysophospholipase L1-like esterase
MERACRFSRIIASVAVAAAGTVASGCSSPAAGSSGAAPAKSDSLDASGDEATTPSTPSEDASASSIDAYPESSATSGADARTDADAADGSADARQVDAIAAPTDAGDAASPGVRLVARTAPGTASGSVRFSWPGVSIQGRFTGSAVSLNLNDGNNANRFTVVVDKGTPTTLTTTSATTFLLASGLTTGPHDLVIWRNTEASIGVTEFMGLSGWSTGGGLISAAVAPDRRLEVVGDSLSVGAGVEGDAACPNGINAYTNNYLAYGSVAARAVGADVSTIAWSGIGVYRNYDGSTTDTMPVRYPYAIPNDDTPWDFSLYEPDVVVINLGTNDFGQGDPGTAYETAYVAFVKTIRSKYANAYFILIDMYGGTRLTRVNDVVTALKSGGETKVETLSFSSAQNNLGCNQHPNVAGQAAMGGVLAARLKALMGW